MSNPEKKWSWGKAFGKATGAAIGVGLAAGVGNTLTTGGLGTLASGGLGLAGGFVGGFLGEAIGYWWDQPAIRWDFRSAALFTMVMSGLIGAVLYFLAIDVYLAAPVYPVLQSFLIGVFSGFMGSALGNVLDNLRL